MELRLGLIVTLVGLIAFGGFAKGKWFLTSGREPMIGMTLRAAIFACLSRSTSLNAEVSALLPASTAARASRPQGLTAHPSLPTLAHATAPRARTCAR